MEWMTYSVDFALRARIRYEQLPPSAVLSQPCLTDGTQGCVFGEILRFGPILVRQQVCSTKLNLGNFAAKMVIDMHDKFIKPQ